MNEQQTTNGEVHGRPGYVGGRLEPSEGRGEVSVDVNSSYPAVVGAGTEPPSGGAAAGAVAAEEEATLPVVPAGAILSETPVVAPEGAESVEGEPAAEVQLRFIGEGGPEVDYISPEPEDLTFEGVVLQLVDAALEAERGGAPLGGHQVAQIFCRGDVEDPRVSFLLLLLAQDKPVDGTLVLAAARATEGLGELVEQAIIQREELARVGEVSVEQLSAGGTFTPMGAVAPAEVPS